MMGGLTLLVIITLPHNLFCLCRICPFQFHIEKNSSFEKIINCVSLLAK